MATTNPILNQAGVIAYRIQDGKVRVLLMTSRDTARWIIPKGNIKSGVTPRRAAEQEAYEEAGVRGTITGSNPLHVHLFQETGVGRGPRCNGLGLSALGQGAAQEMA